MVTPGVKEFSAKVPDEEYEKFKAMFPQYGAVNWFINTSLAEFNKQIETHPEFRQLVNKAVAAMLTERRLET